MITVFTYCKSFFNYLDLYTSLAYNLTVAFEWDSEKNKLNRQKHGISFEEAVELYKMPSHLVLEQYDFKHSLTEDRIISIGPITRGVVIVISTERGEGDVIRLISARFATTSEKGLYEKAIKGEEYE